jgi:hypothetical protein
VRRTKLFFLVLLLVLLLLPSHISKIGIKGETASIVNMIVFSMLAVSFVIFKYLSVQERTVPEQRLDRNFYIPFLLNFLLSFAVFQILYFDSIFNGLFQKYFASYLVLVISSLFVGFVLTALLFLPIKIYQTVKNRRKEIGQGTH